MTRDSGVGEPHPRRATNHPSSEPYREEIVEYKATYEAILSAHGAGYGFFTRSTVTCSLTQLRRAYLWRGIRAHERRIDEMKCSYGNHEATQVGKFWVCDKHGPIAPEQPAAPLRIFLSYGHDANEKLVRRIMTDLEARGHDVWFDKSEIKFGDDWRRSITDGIAKSHKFVSFLSKDSTRAPDICRDGGVIFTANSRPKFLHAILSELPRTRYSANGRCTIRFLYCGIGDNHA